MPNEFVARNGVIALNNSQITGSLNVSAGITGSLFGTASWAQNAVTSSYILSAVSASFATSASLAQTASYVLNAVSASFSSTASSVNTLNQNVIISGSFTVFTGSAIEFQVTNTGTKIGNLLTDIHSVTGSLNVTGSENIKGSGSAVFSVDGTSGRLFQVDDSLSGSLFSVNTAAGLPIIEAFSDNTVRIGQYGQKALYVSQSKVGIGKEASLNGVLDVSGSTTMTGSLDVNGNTRITGSLNVSSSNATQLQVGSNLLFVSSSGQVGIGTTSPSFVLDVAGTARINGNTQITGSLNVNGTSAVIRSGANYGGTSFSNGSWGYARVGLTSGDPTISLVSNVQNATQTLDGITVPRTGSALLFSSTYGYDVGNEYQIISVGRLGVRVGNTTQALTIPTSGIITANQGLIVSGSLTVVTGSAIELRVTNTGVNIGNIITDTHTVTGSLNISGSITTTGTITAQTLVVQTITSSQSLITGSTVFGSLLANTHQFTGSVSITSSLAVTGNATVTGSLIVSGSSTLINIGPAIFTGSITQTSGTASFGGVVGIGTTSPTQKLDVYGSIAFKGVEAMYNNYIDDIYANVRVIRNLSTNSPDGMYINYDSTGTTNAHLRFYANGVTERMRIDASTGNVGIGTTSPAGSFTRLLNINDTNSGGNAALILSQPTKKYSLAIVNTDFRIYDETASSYRLTLDTSGNVGIGTTSPAQKLDVYGGIASYGFLALYANGGADDIYGNIRVIRNNSTTNQDGMYIGYNSTGTTNAHLRFYANGTNERMRIDASTGNVGIGTTSPLAKLDVEGLSMFNGGAANLDGASLSYLPGTAKLLVGWNRSGGLGETDFITNRGGGTVGGYRFYDITNAGTLNALVTIEGAGNVGIGTTSPASLLQVNGTTTITGDFNSNITNGLHFGFGSNIGKIFSLQNGTSWRQLLIDGSPIALNSNGGGGSVGIGTSSPEVKLDVKGASTGTLSGMALFRDASTNGNGLLVRAGTGIVDLLATWISSGINTDLTFTPTTSGGAQNEAMRITSAGRVGIGTTSPTATLTVSGSATINGNTSITGSLIVTGSDAFFNSVRVGRGLYSIATNTVVGISAIAGPTFAAVTGTKNVAVGYEALTLLKSGTDNTAVGYQALASGSIGLGNTAVGSQALLVNVSGSGNTAVGASALHGNITGNNNTAVGSGTLGANLSGIGNVALGNSALNSVVNTSGNTAVGTTALGKADGGSLTAIGCDAASQINTGTNSTVIGYGNYQKPDSTDHTSESNILSLASSNQPEIWGQLAQVSVSTLTSATILSIDPLIYSGAVIDYSLQDNAGNQRTSVMSLAFDCSANVSYTDPNQIEQGGTGDYSFVPSSNPPLVDLVLTNNSGANSCAITISCRLLKRYYACP